MREDGQSISVNSHFKKALTFVIWVGYQVLRLCLGLVVHPYRSVREIMRGRWFVPLVFLPSVILLWIFLSGRIAAWVVDVPLQSRDMIGLVYATFLFSLGMWQVLLFYLGLRFWVGFHR